MTTQALLRLAWRESRTARRRLALYMSSIAFGVAALVAIDSFAGNVTRSIREQSRTLLGGDMALQARAAFDCAQYRSLEREPDAAEALQAADAALVMPIHH